MTSAVSVDRLSVSYGAHRALDGVDLRVAPGTSVAVIGPNGSGKSTLLSAIAGLVAPTAGHVEVDRASLAYVLQSTDVDRSVPITVQEAVRMARYPHRGMFGRFRREDREAVDVAMRRTGVSDLASRQLHELSGGQRQRTLIAQGLAQEAEVLLLDEPITGLDLVSRGVVLKVVGEERAAGRTVIMTTHGLDDAATCDVVVVLANRVVAVGPPDVALSERHLEEAFEGRAVRLGDGRLLLDDPHHHHTA